MPRSWWIHSVAALLRIPRRSDGSRRSWPPAPLEARKRSRPSFPLRLVELLEDRTNPSFYLVTGTGDGAGTVDTGHAGTSGDPFLATTLRAAVTAANAISGADTITFDPTVFAAPQTITLGGTELLLTDTTGATTITGPATGVTVSGNNASRVFAVDANVTASLSGLTITNGSRATYGGGVYNRGTATLTDCTISGNSAGLGGGVYNRGTATLTNCTISGNTTTASPVSDYFTGGGVRSSGTLTMTNCTVSGNSAGANEVGGVYSATPATLINTIVAGNEQVGGQGDLAGQFTGLSRNNLIGVDIGSIGLTYGVSGNRYGINPLLAPLGQHGGPTQTLALLPGSPAIDAGTSTGAPTTDQRGSARVGNVDIGAFESGGFTIAVTSGSGQSTPISTTFGNPLIATVTAKNEGEPVAGGVVTFTSPPTGASASLTGNPATIAAGGKASVTATANGTLGAYTVSATAQGVTGSASFALTNAEVPSLVVTTTTDVVDPTDGFTSLREAINYANAHAGADTITFDPTVFATAKTITLGGTQLTFSDTSGATTITGPAAGVTVDANNASRVFVVSSSVTGSLSGLTITGGNANDGFGTGGGVYNRGTLTLTNCTVSGNSAINEGGGVYNRGLATLTNCTVSGNSANDQGGGVSNSLYGTATLTNCTVSGNSAINEGGGVSNEGTATLTDCTISGNSATNGGGVSNEGTATLTNCTVSGNTATNGGGMFNEGLATLNNCTVSGNSANVGGGMFNNAYATATLTNCTVSGNTATNGGGVWVSYYGTATLTNCTVSGNTAANGGGVFNDRAATTLTNTIVAGQTSGGDVNGALAAASANNLIGNGTGSFGITNGTNGNLVGTTAAPINPLLAPLGDHGGPTQTMALLPGSPAIDAGASAGAPSTDQRGITRGTLVDIGAFESRGFEIAATSGSGQSAAVLTAFTDPLVVTVSSSFGEPVAGGRVTFTAPGDGASAMLAGSPATIGSEGTASATATANGTRGAYAVTAAAAGASGAASFSLTNALTATVTSITRGTPTDATANATSVTFVVTFSEAVLGLTAANFSLSGTAGITGTTNIGTVASTDGGVTWSVTVTGLDTAEGTLILSLVNDTGLDHDITTTLPVASEAYTLDHSAPTATITSTAAAVTGTSPIRVAVTFSKSVTGFTAGSVVVGNGTVSNFAGSGTTYTFDVFPIGQGAVTVDVPADAGQDASGNGSTAAARLTRAYDPVRPAVTIGRPSVPRVTAGRGTVVSYLVSYADPYLARTTLTAGGVVLVRTGTANGVVTVTRVNATTFRITVSRVTGSGTLGIAINPGTAADAAGNRAPATGPSARFAVLAPPRSPFWGLQVTRLHR
jgi:CSLREA domain-containing protein